MSATKEKIGKLNILCRAERAKFVPKNRFRKRNGTFEVDTTLQLGRAKWCTQRTGDHYRKKKNKKKESKEKQQEKLHDRERVLSYCA